MPNILTITVGLPRSGKTTWARSQSFPIVNPDALRLALHGQPFIPEAEPLIWAMAKIMVRSLFLAGHTHVILDATSTTRAARAHWKDPLWVRVYQTFDECKETCIRRARESGKGYLVPVIERMASTQEGVEANEKDCPC